MKWMKRFFERSFGTWEEGPIPPTRVGELATVFANEHPEATRAEWLQFSIKFAGEWYRAGYTRGFEHAERVPETHAGKLPPELLADQMDPDWRWRPTDVSVDLLDQPELTEERVLPGYDLDAAHARLHGEQVEDADEPSRE